MAIGRKGAAARQLSLVLHLGSAGSLTDGQLLERFLKRRDEAAELAFACLVERHGSLVLQVAQSVLRDEHQALDAFQATFLVLVKKARSLCVQDSLAPWLHAVAYRVALRARASAVRRRRNELHQPGATPLMIASEEMPSRSRPARSFTRKLPRSLSGSGSQS